MIATQADSFNLTASTSPWVNIIAGGTALYVPTNIIKPEQNYWVSDLARVEVTPKARALEDLFALLARLDAEPPSMISLEEDNEWLDDLRDDRLEDLYGPEGW